MIPATVASLSESMAAQDYVLSEGLAVSLFLALRRSRPLFLEGEAGVGKTEVAKTLAALLDRHLIRLQCYEGLDINAAAYEWNYARQMMQIQSAGQGKLESADLFTEDNLIERPLLEALREDVRGAPVLLIDELDRADEAFEAYLLEILSDWQITIPEFGTVAAATPPIVIITSNRTREIHDALKRRCFYHWVDYPSLDDELGILQRKAPEASVELSQQVVQFVQRLRDEKLFKAPGVAETIDWAQALVELDCVAVDPTTADSTMGVLLKYQDDIARVRGSVAAKLLAEVQIELVGYQRK
ncbi:MAG: MoxR family ATPase [Alphaproteobacteria bacterium]|jgi:MoxR-like ATPase|nr:MoxR family ATPase [Alphaproteobacteria bacterium]MBL6672568.1 MoxR family ATPase [Alphaproteobacteria bacterium]